MTSIDATGLVIRRVRSQLKVACASDVPNPRPAKFVQVRSSGGPGVREIVLDERLLRFACWAPTDAEAETLALDVRDLIDAMSGHMIDGVLVSKAEASTPYPFDDESSPRYLGQASLLVRRDLT